MNWWKAILLGLVQGLTEFLPVSSSGHLAIAQALLGIGSDNALFFFVMLHFATAISVIVGLWRPFRALFTRAGVRDIGLLALATVPALVVGLLFDDAIGQWLVGTDWLWIPFLGTAAMLFATELIVKHCGTAPRGGVSPVAPLPFGWRQALAMGCMQALGVFPGISRSGATICAGVLARGEREKVADFSFLMSLPVIAGAALLELLSAIRSGAIAGVDWFCVGLGMVAAFASGMLAIRLMLSLVRRVDYKWFSLYLLLLSVALIVVQFA